MEMERVAEMSQLIIYCKIKQGPKWTESFLCGAKEIIQQAVREGDLGGLPGEAGKGMWLCIEQGRGSSGSQQSSKSPRWEA